MQRFLTRVALAAACGTLALSYGSTQGVLAHGSEPEPGMEDFGDHHDHDHEDAELRGLD